MYAQVYTPTFQLMFTPAWTCQGLRSASEDSFKPLFVAARVKWRSRTKGFSCPSNLSKAQTSEPDVWNIPRSTAMYDDCSIPNVTRPPTSLSVCHTIHFCLHPSLNLSILSHCLVILSVRVRIWHSWRGLLSTAGAQLSSLCVLFFCVCESVWRWGWRLGYRKHRIKCGV